MIFRFRQLFHAKILKKWNLNLFCAQGAVPKNPIHNCADASGGRGSNMGKDFTDILEGVIKYEQKERMIVSVVFGVFVIVFVIFAIKHYNKATRIDKVITLSVILVLLFVFIMYHINCEKNINNIKKDLASDDYIIYIGEYTHDNYQKDSFYHNVYVMNGSGKMLLRYPDYSNKYRLHAQHEQLPTGSFSGTIVYANKSKIVLSWSIEA